MNHCNRFLKPLAALTAALLLGVFGAPVCYAYPFPAQTLISSEAQLVEWYRNGIGDGVLTKPVTITGDVKLNVPIGIAEEKILAPTTFLLSVMDGASLSIDNPQLRLVGSHKSVIVVETGGRLVLGQFAGIHVTQNTDAIVIKEGGKLETPYGIPTDVQIKNENPAILPNPPDTIFPPDTRTPITSLYDDKAHISCAVGAQPNPSEYPATVYAYFGVVDGADLPVEWELSKVDFTAPKTYSVTGRIAQAALDEKDLSNPQGLTAKMTITVYEPGAVGGARAEVLSVGASGSTIARLILPALPIEQITAVYLYSSFDGLSWKRESRDLFPVNGVIPTSDNFLPAVTTVGIQSYIPFYYQTDYRSVWIQAEVVGSDRAGMSNAVQLILPEGSKPGDVTSSESSEDAGDSGGNRGGGGQTEEDRTLPPKPDAAPPKTGATAIAAPPKGNQSQTAGTAPTIVVEPEVKPTLAATPEKAPPESAAQVLAATNEPQTVPPPERGQKNLIPPVTVAAVALTGGAGLCGWIFLKKRP